MHEIVSVIGSVMNAIIVVASSIGSSSSDSVWPSTLVNVDVDVDVVDKETVVEGLMTVLGHWPSPGLQSVGPTQALPFLTASEDFL